MIVCRYVCMFVFWSYWRVCQLVPEVSALRLGVPFVPVAVPNYFYYFYFILLCVRNFTFLVFLCQWQSIYLTVCVWFFDLDDEMHSNAGSLSHLSHLPQFLLRFPSVGLPHGSYLSYVIYVCMCVCKLCLFNSSFYLHFFNFSKPFLLDIFVCHCLELDLI